MMEIELDILPDGFIRFGRGGEKANDYMLEILSSLAPEKKSEAKKFLDCSNNIEQILGSESLCG